MGLRAENIMRFEEKKMTQEKEEGVLSRTENGWDRSGQCCLLATSEKRGFVHSHLNLSQCVCFHSKNF